MRKKVLQVLTLAQLRRYIGNSRTIRKFADRHDLVYFGSVTTEDESKLVKGHTISRSQRDEHYCVGTVFGRDMIFVQRSDTVHEAVQKHKEDYTWNILVLDLDSHMSLPHTYIEGRGRYGTAFNESFGIRHRELVEIPVHLLVGYDPLFVERFSCRMPVVHAAELPGLLSPLAAATLAHHFSMFDIEWHDDVVYIYYLAKQPSSDKLDHMLKCGVWLAGELDSSQRSQE